MIIELTNGQKLQIAFILLLLGAAGMMLFANSRPTFDDTVNSWTTQRDTPVDGKQRFDKEKNPYDPKKHEDITTFACSDGQVDLIQTPNDPDKHMRIVFRPEKRQP